MTTTKRSTLSKSKNYKNVVFIGVKKKITDNQVAVNLTGTGLIIKPNKIITCAHIYNEAPEEKTFFAGIMREEKGKINNYDSYDIKLLKKDDKRDFALFKIENFDKEDYGVGKEVFFAEKEIDNLDIGEEVYFTGFPLPDAFLQMKMGITLAFSKCNIASIKYSNIDKKIDFILLDKLINPGNSGSPVFTMNGDKIIGLASGNIDRTHQVSTNTGTIPIPVPINIGIVRTSNYLLDLIN